MGSGSAWSLHQPPTRGAGQAALPEGALPARSRRSLPRRAARPYPAGRSRGGRARCAGPSSSGRARCGPCPGAAPRGPAPRPSRCCAAGTGPSSGPWPTAGPSRARSRARSGTGRTHPGAGRGGREPPGRGMRDERSPGSVKREGTP